MPPPQRAHPSALSAGSLSPRMARSAAAKKVAKAASAGGSGRSFRPRRDILFPAAMLLVVLLGVVLILVARNERS